jgi:hypothetical protein
MIEVMSLREKMLTFQSQELSRTTSQLKDSAMDTKLPNLLNNMEVVQVSNQNIRLRITVNKYMAVVET